MVGGNFYKHKHTYTSNSGFAPEKPSAVMQQRAALLCLCGTGNELVLLSTKNNGWLLKSSQTMWTSREHHTQRTKAEK